MVESTVDRELRRMRREDAKSPPRSVGIPYGVARERIAGAIEEAAAEGLVVIIHDAAEGDLPRDAPAPAFVALQRAVVVPAGDAIMAGIDTEDLTAGCAETVPAAIAWRTLPAIVGRVAAGQIIAVTHRGEPLAYLMDFPTWRGFEQVAEASGGKR